jgi:uncharacterized membrane protein (UPF0127 family)
MRRIIIIILFFGIVFAGWYGWMNREAVVSWVEAQVKKEMARGTVTINGVTVHVDIAQTEAERTKGLSGRRMLPDNEGMFFLFDTPEIYTFWMRGMYFSLDMIWIRDGKVVDIIERVPVPGQDVGLSELPRYLPDEPADAILEVRSGFVKREDIEKGDRVEVIY